MNPPLFSSQESLPQPWTPEPATSTEPASLQHTDTISLRSLSTQAILGPDSWARPKPQPLLISIYLSTDTTSAAQTDNIAQTFSYGVMAKDVLSTVSNHAFTSIDHLTNDLATLAEQWPGETLRIVARAPKALLRTIEGLEREVCLQRRPLPQEEDTTATAEDGKRRRRLSVWDVQQHSWTIRGLRIACIIGVNEHERLEKQDVVIRIRAMGQQREGEDDYGAQIREGPEMWRRLVRGVCEAVEPTGFLTLEALAALVARFCLQGFPFPRVTVGVEKPSAVTFVEGAGVEITRDRGWLGC